MRLKNNIQQSDPVQDQRIEDKEISVQYSNTGLTTKEFMS